MTGLCLSPQHVAATSRPKTPLACGFTAISTAFELTVDCFVVLLLRLWFTCQLLGSAVFGCTLAIAAILGLPLRLSHLHLKKVFKLILWRTHSHQ